MEFQKLNKFQEGYLNWFKGSSPIISVGTNICIVITFAIYSFATLNQDWILILSIIFSGYFIWTLTEYLLHRFVFHDFKGNRKENKFHYLVHGVHHASPTNTIFLPLLLRFLFVFLFFGFFYLFLRIWAFPIFTGFFLGASIYSAIHFAIHKYKAPGMLEHLWLHHQLHHHKYPDKAFGTTTRFWDFVFRTMPVNQ